MEKIKTSENSKWVIAIHGGIGNPPKSPLKCKKIKNELKKACISVSKLIQQVFLLALKYLTIGKKGRRVRSFRHNFYGSMEIY